jgi:UDP-N-acetylglucosamine 3-dehydrogenase
MSPTKPTATLTVGIIGAGQVAQQHTRAFSQLAPEVSIIGIADIDADRAAEMAATCDAQAFTDYQELLDLAPDIAVVCLPHALHLEAGIAAAEAGCHLLMEKPLANTLEAGHAIVDSCRENDVLLTISFVHRYRTELQQARRLIADGKIGTPATAIDNFCSQGGPHVPQWVWEKRQAGGGVLMYGGIHSLDRLRWLVDSEVKEVFARTSTYSQDVDVEDGLAATLVFENGCLATLFENAPKYRVTPRAWDTEIYGSQACIRIRTREHLEFTSETQAYRLNVARDDNFGAQAREFVTAVQEQRGPWISGEDGLRALEIALAIYQSAESGRPVSL